MRRSPTLVLAALLLPAGLVGCSDDGPDRLAAGDGFSVEAALAELPAPPDAEADQPVAASVLDVDAASDAAGLDRPPADADAEEVQDWWGRLSFPAEDEDIPSIPVGPFDAFGVGRGPADEVADDVGLPLAEVHALAHVTAVPYVFGVAQGDLDRDDLAEAGLEERDGVFSSGAGEDLAPNPEEASPSRPTGAPLRLAAEDGRIASSSTTAEVEAWREGEQSSLAEDDAWREVAAALDEHDVVAAVLMEAVYDRPAGAEEAPEATTATDELVPIEEPFTLVGLGFAVEDGETVVTVAYAFADGDAAEAAVEQVEAAYADAASLVTRVPIADLLDVQEVAADGRVVVARLGLVDDTSPGTVITMLNSRDTPFFHR